MPEQITIEIEGRDGRLDAGAFANVINHTVGVLRILEEDRYGRRSDRQFWELVELSMRSPAKIRLSGQSRKDAPDGALSRGFLVCLKIIEAGVPHVQPMSDKVLHGTRKLVASLSGNVSKLTFRSNGESVSPSLHAAANIDRMLGAKHAYIADMAIDGRLQTIDVHGAQPLFVVYDPLSGTGTRCNFRDADLAEITILLKSRVRVYGNAHFNKLDEVTSIDVESFERLPEQYEVPKLGDLHAAGINITSGDNAVDFVDRMRDGERD